MMCVDAKLLAVMAVVLAVAMAGALPTAVILGNAADAGTKMPVVGLGTGSYGLPNGTWGEYWTDAMCETAVLQFLAAGGRRIDTSLKWYHDLPGVGAALSKTSVPRSEIFITSKVDGPYGYDSTMAHIHEINLQLQSNYTDLLLIHWAGPMDWDFQTDSVNTTLIYQQECGSPSACRVGTYRALVDAWRAGLVRAIGVSNYEKRHLNDLLAAGLPMPAVVQIEYHPYWREDAYVQWLQAQGVTVNSYSPLGAPDYMRNLPEKWPVLPMDAPQVLAVARAVGRTPAQVLLRWAAQRKIVVNPRTLNPQHMAENLNIFDFELSADQVASIDAVDRPLRPKVCPDPRLIA